MHGLRNPGPTLLTILLCVMLGMIAHAQTPSSSSPDVTQQVAALSPELPDAPGQQSANLLPSDPQPTGSISGTVLDINGAQVEGALVSIQFLDARPQRTIATDASGSFSFTALGPGTFKIAIVSSGFANWVSTALVLQKAQSFELPTVMLQVASAMTNVDVNFTRYDIAEEQVSLEEKQRVLGVFPNFYVSYTWDAAPLTSGQKFRLAFRTAYDPVSIAIPAIIAGVEQSQNTFSGYGQGTAGYFKRFGASYGDGFIGSMIGNAILPSILHQDPRYFYKGTGTIRSRALYAMSTAFICKGDNGRWQPNYSFILGNFASAGISNLYYPASDRNGAGLTISNALIDTASGAASSLIQEFLVKKISRGIPKNPVP
ncbi:carboxypeptidase-like regulatory domain-containing protein [Granulicella sp. S190]|uniref:carboxypeptidase-like regulatory domain-containing protein n=1 Tax=Granulicella sp. S190 TaxID=1747226 RepID=UPI00131D7196|nr:carboxypeptidase-like regulatory domain-containing protein [Granulicella sp. S190]